MVSFVILGSGLASPTSLMVISTEGKRSGGKCLKVLLRGRYFLSKEPWVGKLNGQNPRKVGTELRICCRAGPQTE